MDPLTHATAGVVISQLIPGPDRKRMMLAGLIFGLLPDIDYILIFIDRLALLRHHRGITHSLIALPVLAWLGALVGRAWGGRAWFRPLFLTGLAVLASHLLLDLVTSYGTKLLSPFSSAKLSLDWVFIIDPVITLPLLAGTVAAFLGFQVRRAAALCLSVAGLYLLLCGFFHQQALVAARKVLSANGEAPLRLAALPQPFSCRRWHLIAWWPAEVRQAFLEVPRTGLWGARVAAAAVSPPQEACFNPRAPEARFQPPDSLEVKVWRGEPYPIGPFAPDTHRLLESFLHFARFPLLLKCSLQGGDLLLTWLDLRFTVPGRSFPFVLAMEVAPDGRLKHWRMGYGPADRQEEQKNRRS